MGFVPTYLKEIGFDTDKTALVCGPPIMIKFVLAGLEELGFSQVYEVALGADIGAVAEAHHYVEKVTTGELPFLLTSCCPSWAMLAKKYFPDTLQYECIENPEM